MLKRERLKCLPEKSHAKSRMNKFLFGRQDGGNAVFSNQRSVETGYNTPM